MKPQTKVISEKKYFTSLKANIFPKLLDYSHTHVYLERGEEINNTEENSIPDN